MEAGLRSSWASARAEYFQLGGLGEAGDALVSRVVGDLESVMEGALPEPEQEGWKRVGQDSRISEGLQEGKLPGPTD